MRSVTKAKALEVLQRLLERAQKLSPMSVADDVFQLWQRESIDAVRNLFGEPSTQYKSFEPIGYSDSYVHDAPIRPDDEANAVRRGLKQARIQLQAMIIEIENYWTAAAPAPQREPLAAVLNICDRFTDVVRQLSTRWGTRPTLEMQDEHDVQYLMGALLVAEFDDVRPENPGQSHAGASSRRDFVLKSERITVETKMTRDTLGAKEVGDELAADILRYEAVADCDALVCFVYDPGGRIINRRGLERDLEATQSRLTLRVRIRP